MSELINLYGWNTVIKKVDIVCDFLKQVAIQFTEYQSYRFNRYCIVGEK